MDKERKKDLVRRYGYFLSWIYRKKNGCQVRIKGSGENVVSIVGVFAAKTQITINGRGNEIHISPGFTRLKSCTLTINGNYNVIRIGKDCNLNKCNLYIEDNQGLIEIGEHTTISGDTHLAVIEGCSITIGANCLFSSNISFRTGDSHSVLDLNTGKRINPSRNIQVGNHVWIGHSVIILKGCTIGNDSIVATGAILTGKKYPDNVCLGGIGGKILKESVNWTHERI